MSRCLPHTGWRIKRSGEGCRLRLSQLQSKIRSTAFRAVQLRKQFKLQCLARNALWICWKSGESSASLANFHRSRFTKFFDQHFVWPLSLTGMTKGGNELEHRLVPRVALYNVQRAMSSGELWAQRLWYHSSWDSLQVKTIDTLWTSSYAKKSTKCKCTNGSILLHTAVIGIQARKRCVGCREVWAQANCRQVIQSLESIG